MTTLSKIIIAALLGALASSCNMDFKISGVKGNGNVTTEQRQVTGDYNQIKISSGLDVYLTQSNNSSIEVEADENLQDIIITEVDGEVLKIYANENISSSASKKVMVTFNKATRIKATSGSDVYGTNTIEGDHFVLETSSGSDMELSLKAQSIDCSASSGSDLELSGSTTDLIAKASSGSDIDAENLSTQSSHVKATSGAGIKVNTSKELIATATSGGDVTYYGNPQKVEKSDNVSGSIKKH
ncbi:head GIN domain-containing protein [Mangrovimonas sp. YM274]|uniref:head GIN domain-containing protein n=1 Tax=Mangrovimonas sp. YM274 TaxID=3070660 RepID=UPI0027DCB38E|nr:head GIN domain-containing protein [Mangrovimonas sp. YM274]WMI67721.1 head GIN domain-containing protein [Mangrovimonas sp. YM274]